MSDQPTDSSAAAASILLPSLRVLIADDHPAIIRGLTTALREHGIVVAGQTGVAAEVAELYASCMPDVVVMDVRFGSSPSGLEVATELLQCHPGARVVFYTQFDQTQIARRAYALGAAAFVTKNDDATVVAAAIRRAHEGGTYFVPEIAERLALVAARGDESPLSSLSARELEVFKYMAQGMTNAEIAAALHLSPKTISNTSQAIKDKLGMTKQAEMTRLAMKHKLLDLEP